MTRIPPFLLLLLLIAGCAQPSLPDSAVIATAASGVHRGAQTAVVAAPTALGGIPTRAAGAIAAVRTKLAAAETAVAAVARTRMPTPNPARTEATVTRIVDGDTIHVSVAGQDYPLRYIGVDSPEPEQPLGPAAAEANRKLVAGKTVFLEKDVSDIDRYDRLLRYVYLADGTFVNAELVRQGYAAAIEYPPDTKYRSLLDQAQQEAQQASLGLWAPTPVPTPKPEPTATRTPTPGPTPTPTQPSAAGQVEITFILYDGAVPKVESDEYAEITNTGGTPVNLAGWRLNADDDGQDFYFPDHLLPPGQSCRVYTNEYHPETCGFSFGIGSAIWANKGECGHLYDPTSAEVSNLCY